MTPPAGGRTILECDDSSFSPGGEHVLTGSDPNAAWQKLERFLDECCDIQTQSASLRLDESMGPLKRPGGPVTFFRRRRPPERERSGAALRAAATATFGHPNRIDAHIAGDGSRTNLWEWPFEPSRMGEALHIVAEHSTYELEGRPAAVVRYEARFFIKDPATGEVVVRPGTAHHTEPPVLSADPLSEVSRCVVRLAGRSTCSLSLRIPFVEGTAEAQALTARLQTRLPFLLPPRGWVPT